VRGKASRPTSEAEDKKKRSNDSYQSYGTEDGRYCIYLYFLRKVTQKRWIKIAYVAEHRAVCGTRHRGVSRNDDSGA